MKFCISTCFPKERCSLTWHYQICSPFIQGVTVLTPHSPTSPFGNRCLSFPEGHEITAGGAGDSLWGRAEPSLSTGSPTPHRKNTVCSEKSGHSFLPPPLPLTLWAPPVPQDGRKLIHQQNPNYFLTGLGTAPPRSPIKCQLVREEHREWSIPLVARSDQLVSNLKLLPQTSFSHNLVTKITAFWKYRY